MLPAQESSCSIHLTTTIIWDSHWILTIRWWYQFACSWNCKPSKPSSSSSLCAINSATSTTIVPSFAGLLLRGGTKWIEMVQRCTKMYKDVQSTWQAVTSYSIAAIRFPVSGLFGHLSQSKPSLSEPFSLAEREEFSNQRQICLVVTPCVGKIKSKRIFEQIPPQFAGPLRSRKLLRSSCSFEPFHAVWAFQQIQWQSRLMRSPLDHLQYKHRARQTSKSKAGYSQHYVPESDRIW
jgi:hypothetical protein